MFRFSQRNTDAISGNATAGLGDSISLISIAYDTARPTKQTGSEKRYLEDWTYEVYTQRSSCSRICPQNVADSLFEFSAIAVPAANMATANTMRFISRNQN